MNYKEQEEFNYNLLLDVLKKNGIKIPTVKSYLEVINIPKQNKIVRNYSKNSQTYSKKEIKQQYEFFKNSFLLANMNK